MTSFFFKEIQILAQKSKVRVWVVGTHLPMVEIDVSSFHVSLCNMFEPLPRGSFDYAFLNRAERIISKLDYPSYARDQRPRVNIAPPTGGEISIFGSVWTNFYGVIIY